ncbi:uncharacterized protein V6R79_014194 [Siganus canaliculatus]
MRDQKILTKSSSSLWKTLRKSDQRSPKTGALNETDQPYRRSQSRPYLRVLWLLVKRTTGQREGCRLTVHIIPITD